MKNFKNLLLITVILPLVFTACKYDEGPGISFRQKRERISNVWKVTNYEVNGVADAKKLASFSFGASATTADSLQILFSIYQSGSYALNLQYTPNYSASKSGNKYYINNQNHGYGENGLFSLIGSNGKWTFVKKWEYVDFGPGDLSHSSGEAKPVTCKIIMLKDKMLKLSFTDAAGLNNVMTFEPGSL